MPKELGKLAPDLAKGCPRGNGARPAARVPGGVERGFNRPPLRRRPAQLRTCEGATALRALHPCGCGSGGKGPFGAPPPSEGPAVAAPCGGPNRAAAAARSRATVTTPAVPAPSGESPAPGATPPSPRGGSKEERGGGDCLIKTPDSANGVAGRIGSDTCPSAGHLNAGGGPWRGGAAAGAAAAGPRPGDGAPSARAPQRRPPPGAFGRNRRPGDGARPLGTAAGAKVQ